MNKHRLRAVMAELEGRRPQSITWTWIDIDGSRHSREIPFDAQLHKDIRPGEELVLDLREVTGRLVSDSAHEWG